MSDHTDKIAIVTGGTRGIGAAIVHRLATEGTHVVFCGRSEDDGVQIEADIRSDGERADFYRADLRNPDEIKAVVNTAADVGGKIDIVVNNAAVQSDTGVSTTPREEWERVVNVNFRAYWLFVKYALEYMSEGAIINISSNHAHQTMSNHFPYNAIKSGIVGMTRAMAVDLGPTVRVNSISPGWIEVERTREELSTVDQEHVESIHPVGRIGAPADIAGVVSFLTSEDAEFITGEDIVVDGGRTAVLQDDTLRG